MGDHAKAVFVLIITRGWKRIFQFLKGFLHENELEDLDNIKLVYNKYWAPLNWALTICMRAYKEECIETLPAVMAVQNVRASIFINNCADFCSLRSRKSGCSERISLYCATSIGCPFLSPIRRYVTQFVLFQMFV